MDVVLALDWNAGILAPVSAFMKLFAVLVVAGTAFGAVKQFGSRKFGMGLVTIAGGILAAAILWNPSLIEVALDIGSSIWEAVFGQAETIIDDPGSLTGGGGAK